MNHLNILFLLRIILYIPVSTLYNLVSLKVVVYTYLQIRGKSLWIIQFNNYEEH